MTPPEAPFRFSFTLLEDEEEQDEDVVIDEYLLNNNELLDAGVTSGADTGSWHSSPGPTP